MNIRNLTNGQLAEYIGPFATAYDGGLIRERMIEDGYTDTLDVSDEMWQQYLTDITNAANDDDRARAAIARATGAA